MSAFVFLFLFVFQPFGIASQENTLLLCLGFGITCLAVMLILNLVIIPLLPGFFNEQSWFVWKEIVWVTINMSAIGIANALYSAWAMELEFRLQLFATFQFYTVAVGLLPIILSVLTNYNRLRNKYEGYSASLSEDVHAHEKNEEVISFTISNGSEELYFNTEQFLYAKSSDNYVEIVYHDGISLKRDVLRKTLKSTSDELKSVPKVFQVHRSYLVNLNKVSHFSGNAQGLKLHFEQTESLVPVSRNLTESLKKQLAIRH
ncbi:MAG: hypothetical protein Crog3KO_00890 [Crocinitomicaceae bacterium]